MYRMLSFCKVQKRQELMCFKAFLCQYVEPLVFLKVSGREGATAPLAPLLIPPLMCVYMFVQVCVYVFV